MAQPNDLQNPESVINVLKGKVRILTMISVLFLGVGGMFGYLWSVVKKKLPPSPVVILSGTIPQAEENDMTTAYNTNASGRGFRTALGGTQDNTQGIYHRLDTLISQLSYWKNTLGVDSVDFRFVEGVGTSKNPGKFNIIILPLQKNSGKWPDRTRYPYNSKNPGTWAFDLGDLHP